MMAIVAVALIVALAWTAWRGTVGAMRAIAAIVGMAGLALVAGIYVSNRDTADAMGMLLLALPALALIVVALRPNPALLRAALVLIVAGLAALLVSTFSKVVAS